MISIYRQLFYNDDVDSLFNLEMQSGCVTWTTFNGGDWGRNNLSNDDSARKVQFLIIFSLSRWEKSDKNRVSELRLIKIIAFFQWYGK
jgi:hypothetical protein